MEDKFKFALWLVGIGIVIGVFIAWVLFKVLGAELTEVAVGPVKIQLPTATNISQLVEKPTFTPELPPTDTPIPPTAIPPKPVTPANTPILPINTPEPTPTLDPSCDTRMGEVREPAAQGEQRTYIRCPVGQVQYSIQVDDFLKSIVLDCPGKTQETITFKKNEQRSTGQLLQTSDTEKFISQPGCKVKITITNGDDKMGYTIWQEVVGS